MYVYDVKVVLTLICSGEACIITSHDIQAGLGNDARNSIVIAPH